MGTDTPPKGSVLKRVFVGSASGALADFVLQGPGGRAMGLLSFWERSVPHQAAELSIWVARDYRGNGYGTDAVLLGVRHVFKRFRLHKIYLRVLWYNTAAIRCYERCGFRKEGRLREEMCVEGVWHDLIYMGTCCGSEFHLAGTRLSGRRGRRRVVPGGGPFPSACTRYTCGCCGTTVRFAATALQDFRRVGCARRCASRNTTFYMGVLRSEFRVPGAGR